MKSGEKKMFIDAKEAGRLLSLSPSFLRKLAREAKIPFLPDVETYHAIRHERAASLYAARGSRETRCEVGGERNP